MRWRGVCLGILRRDNFGYENLGFQIRYNRYGEPEYAHNPERYALLFVDEKYRQKPLDELLMFHSVSLRFICAIGDIDVATPFAIYSIEGVFEGEVSVRVCDSPYKASRLPAKSMTLEGFDPPLSLLLSAIQPAISAENQRWMLDYAQRTDQEDLLLQLALKGTAPLTAEQQRSYVLKYTLFRSYVDQFQLLFPHKRLFKMLRGSIQEIHQFFASVTRGWEECIPYFFAGKKTSCLRLVSTSIEKLETKLGPCPPLFAHAIRIYQDVLWASCEGYDPNKNTIEYYRDRQVGNTVVPLSIIHQYFFDNRVEDRLRQEVLALLRKQAMVEVQPGLVSMRYIHEGTLQFLEILYQLSRKPSLLVAMQPGCSPTVHRLPDEKLNEQQRRAIRCASSSFLHCICGAAGTGKSDVIAGIAARYNPWEVLTVAFPGKIGDTLTRRIWGHNKGSVEYPEKPPSFLSAVPKNEQLEKLKGFLRHVQVPKHWTLDAMWQFAVWSECQQVHTMHHVLYSPSAYFGHVQRPEFFLFQSVRHVVLEEASMISEQLATRFLTTMTRQSALQRTTWVGDTEQLEPIDYGSPFLSLTQALPDYCTELTENYRSKEAPKIIENANRIRMGVPRLLTDGQTVFFIPYPRDVNGRVDFRGLCRQIAGLMGCPLRQVQFLTHRRKLADVVCEAVLQELGHQNPFEKNCRIIFTRNDHANGFCNGQSWTIVQHDLQFREIKLTNGQQEKLLDLDDFYNLKPQSAHCLTVDKSQGEQYPFVGYLVPMFDVHARRRRAYTAFTRTQKKICIVGTQAIWERMIANAGEERQTILTSSLELLLGAV